MISNISGRILAFLKQDAQKVTQLPPKGSQIVALDGVRGIAIFLVMLSHFLVSKYWDGNVYWKLAQGGWLGVDLFFVLSGFLITGILLDAKEKLPMEENGTKRFWGNGYFSSFYKRRVLRIFPLYYFAIFLVLAVVVFIEKAPERLHGYDSWWWYIFFASNIAMSLKNSWTYHSNYLDVNHLWSVSVEEQFYLIWPLIVRLLPTQALLWLCVGLVHFSTPIRYATDAWIGQTYSIASYMMPYCRMDGLAAGAFIAIFLRLGWQQYVPGEKWIVRVLLAWMGYRIMHDLMYGHTLYLFTMSALASAAWLYLALNSNPKALVRRISEHKFLCHLGEYSYGLYVFHHLFRSLYHNAFAPWCLEGSMNPYLGQAIYVILCTLCTYLAARLSWHFLERPFLKLKDAWAKRK